MKISTRLSAAFAVLVAVVLVVAGVAAMQLASMQQLQARMSDNLLASTQLIHRLNTSLVQARLLELRHVLDASASQKATIEREMQALQAEMAVAAQTYFPLIHSEPEQQDYALLMKERQEYEGLLAALLAASRAGDGEQARALLEGRSLELFQRSSQTLAHMIATKNQQVAAEVAEAQAVYAQALIVLAVAGVLAVLIALGAAIWISRSIQRPLRGAVEVADRIAEGDLTAQLEAHGKDELGMLMAALQRMQNSLIKTVQTVRTGADGVATASTQIAMGNSDLSSRTEEQASALEQTAASMEELGSTVRQNAENARQANQLAMNASSVAQQGGEVVGQVVDTMRGINDSSRKIADIIGVIDSIAFQTNILALNAAVEAARAGEQGRGFAVVAGEVRSLAQRSSEAAKEIKELITDSVERVGQGSELVDKAGTTMQEVVTAIRQVTDIVGEISAASMEQSQGVAQVGEAVTQMDQTTQQNAALVEESAAAADSLSKQAQELVEAVSVFKFSHQGAAKAVHQPRAAQPAHRTAQPVAHRTHAAPVRVLAHAAPPPRKPAPAAPQPVAQVARQGSSSAGEDEWESF